MNKMKKLLLIGSLIGISASTVACSSPGEQLAEAIVSRINDARTLYEQGFKSAEDSLHSDPAFDGGQLESWTDDNLQLACRRTRNYTPTAAAKENLNLLLNAGLPFNPPAVPCVIRIDSEGRTKLFHVQVNETLEFYTKREFTLTSRIAEVDLFRSPFFGVGVGTEGRDDFKTDRPDPDFRFPKGERWRGTSRRDNILFRFKSLETIPLQTASGATDRLHLIERAIQREGQTVRRDWYLYLENAGMTIGHGSFDKDGPFPARGAIAFNRAPEKDANSEMLVVVDRGGNVHRFKPATSAPY